MTGLRAALQRLWRYVRNNGEVADIQFNTLFLAGQPDQTTSLHCAEAQAAGRRWGCVACRLLNWVERNHCRLVLEGMPTPVVSALKAGLAFIVFWVVLGLVLSALWRLL